MEKEKSKVRELQKGNTAPVEVENVNSQETIGTLLERIKELESEALVLQQEVDSKDVAIGKLEDLVQNVEAEKETSQMQSLLDALSKVTHLEEHIATRDETINELENELEICKSQSMLVSELQGFLNIKDDELLKLSDKCTNLEKELEDLKDLSNKNLTDGEKKYKEELKKKEEVFESHSKFIKSKVFTA